MLAAAIWAACGGALMFCLLLDASYLWPGHVGWLAVGDSAQSYMGWLAFRAEPWMFPLGRLHALGLEQAHSIVYSDSIPLLALVFKLFRRWLPATFQYDGIWLCLCYVLQGYFACRLLSLFTRSRLLLAVGTVLFLLSPIMLLRAQAHLALSAHWIIVCALYLYYVPPSRGRLWQWLVLLWLVPLVQAYLVVMAYAIWAAYLLRYLVLDRARLAKSMLWAAPASIGGSLLLMWLAGYFGDMDVSAGGFGFYSMNLLSPFMPVGIRPFLMPTLSPATAGQYEGFNYLGAGVLLALMAGAVWWCWRGRRPGQVQAWQKRPGTAIALCAWVLTALAVSNVVTFGSHVLFTLPLPTIVAKWANTFRCSGRLFWPVYYLLMLVAVRGLSRLPVRGMQVTAIVVLLLQFIDLQPFLQVSRHTAAGKVADGHFPQASSAFWNEARARYSNLYVIPGHYSGDEYIAYEMLALSHGFGIDTAYYARLPAPYLQRERTQRHDAFFRGKLDAHGLYLVQPDMWQRLARIQNGFPAGTGMGMVDGFHVVAPGWFAHGQRGVLHHPSRVGYSEALPGHIYHFSPDAAGLAFQLAGWSHPGDGGTWSSGATAELGLRVASPGAGVRLVMGVLPYLPAAFPKLTVDVSAGQHLLARWSFERGKPMPVTVVRVPSEAMDAQGNLHVELRFDQPRSPLAAGESADPRDISVNLQSLQVETVRNQPQG